jgi:hypothetical protein
LQDRQRVTVSAPALDLNVLVAILDHLLSRAKQARVTGLNLEEMLKGLALPPPADPAASGGRDAKCHSPAPAAVVAK